jgi:hypothetical protein
VARAWAIGLLLVLGLHRLAMAGDGAEAKPVVIGLMEFTAKGGVSQQKADALMDILAETIADLGNVEVVTRADMKFMLDLEKLKRLAGCSDEECFAEISGALGMRWIVTGNISRFGKIYVLNLKLADVRDVMVVGRVSRRVRGGEEELLEGLPAAARELFERVAARLGLPIQERVTVAARYPQPLSQSPSAVWVITREDIETSGANTIPDLLRLVPGMDVVVSTSAYQSITSRLFWSGEGNHYLVLIDGRETNWEMIGFPIWEIQPIFLEDIERIEIIRGPASAIYGANAFAGVVSIITRRLPGRSAAGIVTVLGESGRSIASLRASARLWGWSLAVVGGAHLETAFLHPRESFDWVWKLRVFAERRWSETGRFLVDAGISPCEGPFSTPLGANNFHGAPSIVRLGVDSEGIEGHVYWLYYPMSFRLNSPIDFAGARLASFVPVEVATHVFDARIEWKPIVTWEPLLIVAGTGTRISWAGSDQLLDATTFSDPQSSRYHHPGISHLELRAGVFVHAELALADWVTITGGTRLDYNTQTDWFVSPRLAAVAQLAAEQYLRLGLARSFRKPSIMETSAHFMVDFPEDGIIQGDAREEFLEFMTRVSGNDDLDDEELLSFEAGWMGRFLEGRLSLELDIFYNRLRNMSRMVPEIVVDEQGLPDLQKSSFMIKNEGPDLDILGYELSVRFSPSRNLHFVASWAHRQVYDYSRGGFSDESPKNLITLGGRFRTDFGMLGSLYAFARSEFLDGSIENPSGILQPLLSRHLDNMVLFLGKLGQRFELEQHVHVEVGVKLSLPVSFAAPHFRYYEAGGGVTPSGQRYGAEQLGRVVTGYLEGAF